jgi:hypothetical protein
MFRADARVPELNWKHDKQLRALDIDEVSLETVGNCLCQQCLTTIRTLELL